MLIFDHHESNRGHNADHPGSQSKDSKVQSPKSTNLPQYIEQLVEVLETRLLGDLDDVVERLEECAL